MKKLLSVLLAVIFAACSLSLVSAEPKATDPTREPGVGMNVSNFNTVDLDGNTVTGDILQNADLTFINYWATWCPLQSRNAPHSGNARVLLLHSRGGCSVHRRHQ